MIEKLDSKMECVELSVFEKKAECLDFEAARKLNSKINELVDAVNTIQKEREAERFEIQEWIGILEAVRKSVNIHEKQIDELQMELEPEKCETRAENVQDKFAKQQKWIGCLVEYGNADDGFRYGILTNIEPLYSAYPFEIDNGRDATADCWLPSKTIFYKGGNNE